MSKKKAYQEMMYPLISSNDYEGLKEYILKESNLPGRMANLTLCSTVADIFEAEPQLTKDWYPQFKEWFHLKSDGNDAETVVIMSTLETFGGMYQNSNAKEHIELSELLHQALNDERWRIREIVTESYKRIGLFSYDSLINLFEPIMANQPTPLEIRGLLATLAHPDLLKSAKQLHFSQKVLEDSFDYYSQLDDKLFTKEDKIVLKKGLSFAPSVIVSQNPEEGFLFFNKLISQNNKEIANIVKQNLQKKRLSATYPDEVEKLLVKIKEVA